MKSKFATNLFWALMVFLTQTGFSLKKEQITIIDPKGNQVIEYAVSELSKILSSNFNVNVSSQYNSDGWNIVLTADSSMQPFSFSVKQPKDNRYRLVYLSGHDETCVLHSVYTMLEIMGYTFDLTGIRKPLQEPSINCLEGYSKTIYPKVERRGIRQHINFLMDISSYPLDEAKEYIRNLARLRMNYITFHSYPGQWVSYKYKDVEHLAGNFFYGEQDLVPTDSSLKKLIRNDSIYCIPSIEPFWNNMQKRSQMAIQWLNAVMAEAKKVGLQVNFSYELREPGLDYAQTAFNAILNEYPLIDGIEFITEEDAPNYIAQVENDIKCAETIKKHLNGRRIQFTTGIYNTTESELKKGFEILRNTPEDISLSVLPAHGARMVVKNLSEIPLTSDDINRTMIYSWIQFDGLMYMQQNPVEGIRRLLDETLTITGGKPIYGICWNHWQNYENRTAARYASEAMIEGPIVKESFYDSFAKRLGIVDSSMYSIAMNKLDEADNFCRDSLFNIGFCPNKYWLTNSGLSLYGRYKKETLLSAIGRYNTTENDLRDCIAKTKNKSAKRDLQFLVNRINCSVLHLKAFVVMTDLQPLFKGNPNPLLSKKDHKLVVKKCSEAITFEKDYLDMFSKFMLDRGCEGSLVSYLHGPVQSLKNIKAKYGYGNDSIPVIGKSIDAPPVPGQ